MGAYTGLPFISDEDREFALHNIMEKTASAMVSESCPLTGVLYGGLMKTADGIKVIEFNARFGDPETEVVLPLLRSDIYDTFSAIAEGREPAALDWKEEVTMGVVLASKGYPGHYEKGFLIEGTEDADCHIYHMGTARDAEGKLRTSGGRVMMCVTSAPSLPQAREKIYREIGKIRCDNLFHRSDIAHTALEYYK